MCQHGLSTGDPELVSAGTVDGRSGIGIGQAVKWGARAGLMSAGSGTDSGKEEMSAGVADSGTGSRTDETSARMADSGTDGMSAGTPDTGTDRTLAGTANSGSYWGPSLVLIVALAAEARRVTGQLSLCGAGQLGG